MVRPNKETIRSSTIPYGLEDEGLAKRIYGVNSKESIEKLGEERKEMLKEYQKGMGNSHKVL